MTDALFFAGFVLVFAALDASGHRQKIKSYYLATLGIAAPLYGAIFEITGYRING